MPTYITLMRWTSQGSKNPGRSASRCDCPDRVFASGTAGRCHRFRSNEVRLWLSLIAYNLGNLWRRLVLPRKIENLSMANC
jgi:hypothetical protein